LEEAIEAVPELDSNFVRDEWREAFARGGCDWDNKPIRFWNGYLLNQQKYRAATAPDGPGLAPKQRLELFREELAKIEAGLLAIGSPNREVLPDQFQRAEKLKAPLRARKKELMAEIEALRKS
jgi:hypothetical protein